MSYILGISSFFHDSAATLIIEDRIIGAVQEERFTRIKHDDSFPINSIKYLLKEHNISLEEIEAVIFYEKPFLKFERLLETYLAFAPRGWKSFAKSIPIWLKTKLFQKNLILNNLKLIDKKFKKEKIKFCSHHLSHAASAYFPSPYMDATILVLDGVGEWDTATIWSAENNKIENIKTIQFPHSIGLLYSAFTYYLGFKVNSGEYKVMGLAPYGNPKYKDIIKKELIDIKEDGSFQLNMKYFDFATGLKMTNKKFDKLFDFNKRNSETEIKQVHMDIAASIQNISEEIILKITSNLKLNLPSKNLCLAGGVALNCVANGKILSNKIYNNIWIQPASGDAGGSLGAALAYWHIEKNNPKKNDFDSMEGSFLGPKYEKNQIEESLNDLGAKYIYYDDYDKLLDTISEKLAQKNAVGWFQGRMEFGPRSLGARSIIADPREIDMQKILNLKVKFRESFRPFAPAILLEHVGKFFDLNCESPYMLLVSQINKSIKIKLDTAQENLFGIEKLNTIRSTIPSVTHVDFSARIQTVANKTNPKFYKLINKFYEKTNCPILINTSFNVRGEPIVCNTKDAFNCFMGTNLDILVLENFVLFKEDQNKNLLIDYRNKYNLD